MSDPSGPGPEERLPATRPESTPAPVERFSAPRSGLRVDNMDDEQAAGI